MSSTGSSENPITNIVVVMLENRSYDNVLGWLYDSGNAPPYQVAPAGQAGLNGLDGSETNPNPFGSGTIGVANQITPTMIAGAGPSYAPTTIPIIDPGEPFDDMAQQITGSTSAVTSNPYTNWDPSAADNMQGFTFNYQAKATAANIADVMNYLTPAQLPVTAFLANNYAVCDTWFASIPTQTFSNRVFGFCSAPGVVQTNSGAFSLIDDAQYLVDGALIGVLELPSVLSYLDTNDTSSSPSWKIYFHDYSLSIMTVPYVAAVAATSTNINLSTYDNTDWGSDLPKQLQGTLPSTFVEDIQNRTLPPFSFIEPRYSDSISSASPPPAPNCNHPGPSAFLSLVGVDDNDAPIDAASGELLLMDIYNTLRSSPYWDTTLLIVTYDEHGGVYDHVPPPLATPPGTINWDGQSNPPLAAVPSASDDGDKASDGFTFNVFGGRVPALAISKYIAQGSTLSSGTGTPFDHSSLVRTVFDCLGFPGANLTERDLVAPSVMLAVDPGVSNPTGPFSSAIVAAPSSLVFHLAALESSKTSLIQTSAGAAVLDVSSPPSDTWLSATIGAQSGPNATQAITVVVTKSGLSDGTYTSTLTISAPNSDLDEVEILVTLVVAFL